MKKTVYLHVGSPKTGTTSLQVFLEKNSDHLVKQGFFVPPYNLELPGHHELILSLIKEFSNFWFDGWPKVTRSSQAAWEDLIEQIDTSECPNVIITTEFFFEITNTTYRPHLNEIGNRIKNYLSKYDVHVIAYIRPIDEYIDSSYREGLKVSNTVSHVARDFQTLRQQHTTQFYPSIWLEFYADLFGKNSLVVRKYARSKLLNQSIVHDFMGILEITGQPPQDDSYYLEENPSLQEDHINFKRALNTAGSRSSSLNRRVSNIIHQVSSIFDDEKFNADFWAETSNEILKEHKKIKERYGIDLGSDIKPRGTKRPTESFPEYLKFGLIGLLINQSEEIDRRTREIDRKADDLMRHTFNTKILPYVRKATPAIVYPAGAHANWLMQNTILTSANIIAWVDRNPENHCKTYHTAPIILPRDIPKHAPGVIFIASPRFGQEIINSLIKSLPAATDIVLLS